MCYSSCTMNARRLSQQNLNEQVQSDDEDVGEFEYEDFPTMPEFLRQNSPYSASSQQYEGRSYKPLGRKRLRESTILTPKEFTLQLRVLITPKSFDSKCWRLPEPFQWGWIFPTTLPPRAPTAGQFPACPARWSRWEGKRESVSANSHVISTVIMLNLIYARGKPWDACIKALKIHGVVWHFSRHGDPRLHSELGSRDQHDQEHVQENEVDGKEKETT